jgi:RNA polymerase sigma-70 factor, ECF subfamily
MEDIFLLLSTSSFESQNDDLQREIYFAFYHFYYPVVFFMVKDHAATEDILQEAFLKIILKIHQLESRENIRAWIKVVVRNTMYNYLRKHKNIRNEVDTDSVFINNNVDYSTGYDSIEKHVESTIMSESISKLINELRPEYKVLIELRWKREMSYKEIGEELNLNENTVKSRLHRIRESVKKRFLREWGDPIE